jgi:EAL domain-containing protein (putative c-di-GMP-specific phosphodiesterase class I)
MAVNLSPRQFRDEGLVDNIQKTIESYAIAYEAIELEITEGMLMNGHAYVRDTLRDLERLGIPIAMDDFGTGYSSLNYLRRYPFHVLKIDRSFVKDIASSSKNRELIIASIAMAHGLNLKVVAEGVETEEQSAFLKAQSCDFSQGYLYSPAVTADDFIHLFKTHL